MIFLWEIECKEVFMKKLLVVCTLALAVVALGTALASDRAEVKQYIPPGDLSAMETVTDTLLAESFDLLSPGELPDGWSSEDLTAIVDEAFWHMDDYSANGGDSAWWCGDDNPEWANPPGYGNDWHQLLILDLDLTSETGNIVLNFYHRYEAESADPWDPPFDTWDGMNVQVSLDEGSTWDVIEPYDEDYPYDAIYAFNLKNDADTLPGYSGPLQEWTDVTFLLSDYVGQEIQIGWVFASDTYASDEDGMYNSDGAWFIDDITVAKYPSLVEIYSFDCETAPGAEWTATAALPNAAGDYWEAIDNASHPQPDGEDVFYSSPNGMYCGDKASSLGDGTYTPGDHGSTAISDVLTLSSLDCSDYDNVELKFMERQKGDGAGGYGYIDISYDGGETWSELEMNNFAGKTGWQSHHDVNLLAGGESNVSVRFRVGSGTAGYDHYVYWYLDDVTITGERELGVDGGGLPAASGKISLGQNMPNPFNPRTEIHFEIDTTTRAKLTVFDLLGKQVTVLFDNECTPGNYTAVWNGTNDAGQNTSSGIYFYTLEAAGERMTKKMLMLK